MPAKEQYRAWERKKQMNQTIERLTGGEWDNHVLPFFWQHGEDETTLREMMAAIDGANCGAVCVESRPHPDFCGPGWWRDMDIILDEARRRGMKVWILDDSHFPTGYANGAVQNAPAELCKRKLFSNSMELSAAAGRQTISLRERGLMQPPEREGMSPTDAVFLNPPPARVFDAETDEVLSVTVKTEDGTVVDLSDCVSGETVTFDKTEGIQVLEVVTASFNSGYRRDYINMTEPDSCRILIDTVYEAHYAHYADDFGKTIAGFFSDEPELGNGFLYNKGNILGCRQDLPWGKRLAERVAQRLGDGWRRRLPALWRQGADEKTSFVHYVYMDELTKLVRDSFSRQAGDWCREHGVAYIGHMIEDDGQHCRTGSGLGHYFRGLEGQDMAGIDDIGGQVLPQGEDAPVLDNLKRPRSGEFYHYGLAKLAQSAAAIEPLKNGKSMCEIFGNYGWQEGVKLEKYLADHFLVRGISHFVPHAFSGLAFPDPDCPPHFYAHGHNPQYRHFGELVSYMNRVATVTSSGKHAVPVAVLYHGEAEWCDPEAMPFEKPLRVLYDRQTDCHVLPSDVFANPEFYRAKTGNPFLVNGQAYEALVIPGCKRIAKAAAEGIAELKAAGLPVFFVDRKPEGLCEGDGLPEIFSSGPVVALEDLADAVAGNCEGMRIPVLTPADARVRVLQIHGETEVFFLVNEGTSVYEGTILLPGISCGIYRYDAWFNRAERAKYRAREEGVEVSVRLAPLKSCFLVCGECGAPLYQEKKRGGEIALSGWTRSVCEGASYPQFSGARTVTLPDALAEEEPEFSGFVRYETHFSLERDTELCLVITDAQEGVEGFLNGAGAGIQIAPEYIYELSGKAGENTLVIEVATTLERQCYPALEGYAKMLAVPPVCGSGITGEVHLYAGEE